MILSSLWRCLFIVGILIASPSKADIPLSLKGDFSQGALIIGETAPSTQVVFNGKKISVSQEGLFLLGLSRNAEKLATLELSSTTGESTIHTYNVAQREYDIQRIDGLPKKQVTPDPAIQARIKKDNTFIANARKQNKKTAWFSNGFQWPLEGRISGVFGSQRVLNDIPKSPHNGVDIAAPTGSAIQAMADGVVTMVHPDMFYTGKSIIIDHGFGLTSVYVHMSEILVSEGQVVIKGEPVGKVGKTGRATGPHLHWGVTLFSTHLDPELVAGPRP